MKNEVSFIIIIIIILNLPLSSYNVKAQYPNKDFKIASIPHKLEIYNSPINCSIIGDTIVELASIGKTNLFNNPNGKYYVQDAPMLLFEPDTDFVFSAKVFGNLKDIYDVAALVIFQDNDTWAKLCFENSVDKEATIVSVVTRKYSDDCNSISIDDNFAYLSIVKKGNEFSFFYSKDGHKWKLIRHFRLDLNQNIKIGFAVHCSRGNGFSAKFSDIKYMINSYE
jgi:uncharacterized protein